MKKPVYADETKTDSNNAFSAEWSDPNQITVTEENALQQNAPSEKVDVLDTLFSLVKWAFLYLPGVGAIHLATMGLALMVFYGEFEPLGLLGLLALGTFLIMLAFGKLRDLKYLKTVLTILAFSLVTAILYDVLAVFIKGDFFSFYTKLTYPVIVLIGYLSKRAIDREGDESSRVGSVNQVEKHDE